MQQPSSQATEPEPSQHPNSPRHPESTQLRHRAADLRRLAASIERSLVMALDDVGGADTWDTNRARLCERMLSRNLHQLHQAADDLRESALRFCRRADELDLAHRARVA